MNPELRQRPIADSIVWTEGDATWHQVVVYEPGNGSRYVIRFDRCSMSTKLQRELGSKAEATMVTDMLHGTSFLCQPGFAFLSADYVAKKLRRSLVDGQIIAELIGQYTARQVARASALEKP